MALRIIVSEFEWAVECYLKIIKEERRGEKKNINHPKLQILEVLMFVNNSIFCLVKKEKALGVLTVTFQYLKGAHTQEGEQLFVRVDSDRTRGNGFKLRQGRFRLDIRRKFFTQRVVTH